MDYIQWLRSKVGRRKIFLAFASLVLRDEQGRILLQQRTDFDFLGIPGGVLEPGESIQTCAVREAFEETGFSVGNLSLVGVYTDPRYEVTYPNGDQVQQYTVCFQGVCNGGASLPDGVETRAQTFYAPDELPWERLPPHYTAMLKDTLSGGPPAFLPPFTAPQTTPQIESLRPLIGNSLLVGVGAMAVTVREDGRILMTHRCDDGDWDFPGGYSNLGENAAQTAVRETAEETGYEILPQRILGIFSPAEPWVYPNGDAVQSLVTVFHARLIGGSPRPDLSESSEIAWMTPAEIRALDAHPSFRPLLHAALDHLEDGYFVL